MKVVSPRGALERTGAVPTASIGAADVEHARAIARPLPRGLTPLAALGVVEHAPHTIFLESGGAGGEWTILAFDPAWRLVLLEGALTRVAGGRVERLAGHPLEALAAVWPPRFAIDDAPDVPFLSGLAGFIAYDFKDWLERYPARARRELPLPDLSLGFYDVVWAWRRDTGEGWVVATGLADPDPRRREARAQDRLEEQWERVVPAAAVHRGGNGVTPASAGAPISNFTRDSYCRMVETALEHIAAGDIYQVNLAQRFRVDPAPGAVSIYHSLRRAAPAPFLAYVSLDEEGSGIASSSPERFFRIDGSRRIETWPIKGTRPRGRTPAEDEAFATELVRSAKDRAENVMIVDLERNDLGRVCTIGSVRVPSLCEVASHSNVHHLESRVEGDLRPDVGPVDVLRALFPGGSITGTPKIRSVEIIDALEPVRRGVYTGAIGYWDARGSCDWNIAIRTIVAHRGVASFHAGGGIVADSTPEGEYEETLVKAAGMMRALGVAG